MGHPAPDDLAQVGGLRLDVPVESVATTRRTIVVSTPDELWLVNAAVPALPTLSTKIPVSAAVSMAGNGDSVLMLDAGGVSRLDLSTGRVETVASGLTASGVYWAGRDIYLATDDGLQRYRDISPQGANFVVQVGDVFFDPAGAINVNVGDTVEWQKPATVFAHNVFSCNAAQTGCGGVASTEVFSSGTVTTAGFNFQHTFSTPGNNPYLCQAHTLSMQGDVVVAGGPASPPGVADGTDATTPMTVDRPVPAGTDLIVTFDTSCPEAADHNILVGRSSDLPSTLGGTYTPGSAQCDVGTASPFVWTTSPSPTPGDFVWWVLVADDGSGTEGSWGIDSAGTQRNGAAAGGASGLCTNTQKDLTNTCGQ
jgi:plastocyanin